MITVLFISSFQYSGSTLASFLLNSHPKMATIGHTGGWPFDEDEVYYCSCGEPLTECPFYLRVREAFEKAGLPFDYRNFGTRFTLSGNERFNRYLVTVLPKVESNALERLRDRCVRLIPSYARTLERQLRANVTLMRTTLEHHGARVFVDNSHTPFYLRLLARSDELNVINLNLVRDPHGVVNSCRRHRNWPVEQTMQVWLKHLRDMFRVSAGYQSMTLHYEDLCRDTDPHLNRVFDFAGVEAHAFDGDFKSTEHHILGNQMRLGKSEVKLDERWRRELDEDDIRRVQSALVKAHRKASGPLADALARYLHDSGAPG